MSPAAVQHLGKDKENIQPSLSLLAGKEHPLFTDPSVSKRQENPSILHAQTYLFSPLTTLLASSQSQSPITPHDLLEAYHTLSCRLKALLPLIIIPGSGDVRIEALERLRSNASQLVQVLKRDIERALVNPLPFSSPSYTTTSSSYPYLSFSNQTASLSSGARYRSTTHIQLLNLTPADLQRASDEVGICHAALGLVGVLFRFECLFRLFEAPDLRTLLHSALSLIPTPQFTNNKNKHLPTPSSAKTRSLVVWLLQTQRLPKEILDDTEGVSVINAVGGILAGFLREGGGEGGEGQKVVGDALKAFKNLLISLPSPSPSTTVLLRALTNLLPNVLEHLVSSSAKLRWDSAGVLGKVCVLFVCGCGDSGYGEDRDGKEIEGMWDICAGHVRAFIDAYSSRRNNAIRLSDVLSTALHASSDPDAISNLNLNSKSALKSKSKHGRSGSSASWAIHTLLTLLLLSSPPAAATTKLKSAYTHPRSLKLFVTLFGEALNSTRKEVRRGGVSGWAVLVWVFGRLGGQGAGVGEKEGEELDADVEERAFRVVKQELGAGIGVLLVNVLLSGCGIGTAMETASGSAVGGPRSRERRVGVGRVVVVVGDMIRSERKSTAKEGVEILGRLVSGIGSSISISPSTSTATAISSSRPQPWTPPCALCDGTLLTRGLGALLQGEQHHNSALGSDLGLGFGSGSEDVRQLMEAEIGTWWEVLIRIWGEGVERFLLWVGDEREREREGRKVVCDHLVQIWQSLLLVQAQLTQGHGHLTTRTEFAHRIASLLSGFLVPPLQPPTIMSAPLSSTTADSQHNRLKLVLKLWRVVKNVFAFSWLPKPAERILRSMLGIKWYFLDERVKGAWGVLSAELAAALPVGAGGLFLLDNLNGSGDRDDTPTEQRQGNEGGGRNIEIEMKRGLWGVLAKSWKGREVDVGWEDAVRFLGIPFGVWAMNHSEIGLWESMLRCAIAAAGTVSVTSAVVVEMVLHRLGERKVNRSSRFIEVTGILLSYLDVLSMTTLPTEIFMMFNEIIENLYPPLHPQDLPPSLQLLCTLKAVIIATPLSLVVPLLMVLQRGLCVWIEDKKEVIPEIDYNDVIMSLYTDTLTKLRNHPLSVDLLRAFTPFFASAFSRIPPPALGPLAFQAFWKATYHGKDEFFREIPPKLRACLKAFDDAYGDDLAIGLSHDVESQSIGSSVPDSEPSRAVKGLIRMPLLHGSPQNSPKAIIDVQGTGFEQNAHSSSPESFEHEAAADSTSILHGLQTLTPLASRAISSVIPPVSALSQLKDYSSHIDDSVDISTALYLQPLRPEPLRSSVRSQILPSRQFLKRPHDIIEETSPKRARTEPTKPTPTKSAKDLATILVEPLSISQLQRTRSRKQMSNFNRGKRTSLVLLSEPTSRVMSPVAPARHSSAPTPSHRRMRFDGVEVPTYSQILEQERGVRTPSPGFIRSPQSQELSDDFNSWEASLDISDLRSLQNGDISVPDTEMYGSSDVELRHGSPIIRRNTSPPIEGPSVISPFSVRRGQSQILAQVSPPRHPLLRRARTISVSARLGLLHEAYNVVSNDASQMQVQDLVQATRLVHQIGSVLNEHMGRRLNDRSEGR